MTVKQLSDFLATVPQDAEVCVVDGDGWVTPANGNPWTCDPNTVLGLKMDTVLDCVVIG